MSKAKHADEARAAMRTFASNLGGVVSDKDLDESERRMRVYNDNVLSALEGGSMRLRHGFCSWNVSMTLLFQGQDFSGFKMVFGSMGFKLGSEIWWEYGGPEYITPDQFGDDCHYWMENAVTGEVADVSFPEYRAVMIMRSMNAKVKLGYRMLERNDFKWFIATPKVWQKYGVVHLPAPNYIQDEVDAEFTCGEWVKKYFSNGKLNAADFKKFTITRVAVKI